MNVEKYLECCGRVEEPVRISLLCPEREREKEKEREREWERWETEKWRRTLPSSAGVFERDGMCRERDRGNEEKWRDGKVKYTLSLFSPFFFCWKLKAGIK